MGAGRSHRERLYIHGGVSQSVVLGSPASKPHRGFLKMQIPRGGIPNLLTQESLRVVPGNLHFKFTPERIQL